MTNYQTSLVKATNTFLPMVESTLEGNNINMSEFQKQCVMNAIISISNVLDNQKLTLNEVETRSLTESLIATAVLELNPSATPREIYFIVRKRYDNGKYTNLIEYGIEGDGNDALLANFGRGVKTVHKFWEVRSEDKFTYPMYKGLDVVPPTWQPTGKGRIEKIVYPITKVNGEVEYLISEREDVRRNLFAHIQNNLMNETFGIAKNKYKATDEQKVEINARKKELLDLAETLSLDDMLSNEALESYISPAYKGAGSTEAMITRKMRNNVVKKYPKDFKNGFVTNTYENSEADFEQFRKDVTDNQSQHFIDFDTETVNNSTIQSKQLTTEMRQSEGYTQTFNNQANQTESIILERDDIEQEVIQHEINRNEATNENEQYLKDFFEQKELLADDTLNIDLDF